MRGGEGSLGDPRGQARQCFRSPSGPLIPIPPTFFRRTRFFGGISTFYCRRGGGGRCGASLWRRSRSRKGPGPMGAFASAVRSCDRLRILRAQRKRLAEELDYIVKNSDISINILSGNINKLKSTSIGYLLVELIGSDEEINKAIELFKKNNIMVEAVK